MSFTLLKRCFFLLRLFFLPPPQTSSRRRMPGAFFRVVAFFAQGFASERSEIFLFLSLVVLTIWPLFLSLFFFPASGRNFTGFPFFAAVSYVKLVLGFPFSCEYERSCPSQFFKLSDRSVRGPLKLPPVPSSPQLLLVFLGFFFKDIAMRLSVFLVP